MSDADQILALLRAGSMTGRDLRARLNAGRWWWQKWSGPGFYRLMTTLEDVAAVYTTAVAKTVEGERVVETWFHYGINAE